jgi:hypothetical protein
MPAEGQLAAGQLAKRIRTQGIGVILVGVAAGQLEDALAHEILRRVARARRVFAPISQASREGGTDPKVPVHFDQPGQPGVGGADTPGEGRIERGRATRGEPIGRYGVISHELSHGRSVLSKQLDHNRRGWLISSRDEESGLGLQRDFDGQST